MHALLADQQAYAGSDNEHTLRPDISMKSLRSIIELRLRFAALAWQTQLSLGRGRWPPLGHDLQLD
ncbi:MAG TPA: hypothetical protein DEP32_10555 [Pseudomonas sp.]|nr:hypothetical protein [Pseudomonas sp.]MAQ52835.1 hypothetical protein [Pseudomonas sp.]MBB49933.1 hypothetical protein [Pseudomonadales bacterium]MBB52690.1 hypothetical protein [Pseudomonadales bacterium]HCA24595.1 hypothetical protein [Pseudomonas sp.]